MPSLAYTAILIAALGAGLIAGTFAAFILALR